MRTEEAVAYACERIAELAADAAVNAAINEYMVEPACAALGINPQYVRIGLLVYQTFSLYRGACFPAGTLVHTEHGALPIETLEAGMKVWSFDFERNTWRLCEVQRRLERRYAGRLVAVGIGDESIVASANHPFWVTAGVDLAQRPKPSELTDEENRITANGRWVETRHVKEQDVFMTRGNLAVVTETCALYETVNTVYNLTIALAHNFAVGAVGVLVHNGCAPNEAAEEEFESGATREVTPAQVAAENTAANQFQTREFLFAGPGGFLKFGSSWEVIGNGQYRFTTAIPFGGPGQ